MIPECTVPYRALGGHWGQVLYGEKIELDLLPDGRAALKASRPAGTIDAFLGLLAGKTAKIATIEEMNDAAARGWAGKE